LPHKEVSSRNLLFGHSFFFQTGLLRFRRNGSSRKENKEEEKKNPVEIGT
jgi:hypothetical protein